MPFRFSSWIQIRRPGVAFDVLERCLSRLEPAFVERLRLASEDLAAAARAVRRELPAQRRVLRALERRIDSDELPDAYRRVYERWLEALHVVESAIATAEVRDATALVEQARRHLPGYLVFASASVGGLVQEIEALAPDDRLGHRHERSLLLYLQRLCTKNETMSAYGPSQWARLQPSEELVLDSEAALRRTCFVEKRTAMALVAALERDDDARAHLPPRLHPFGELAGSRFVRVDRGDTIELDADEQAIVARCDGTARDVGPLATVASLAARGVLDWQLHLPAGADRMASLRAAIAAWPESPARARWLGHVDEIEALREQFASDLGVASRRTIVGAARTKLAELGTAVPEGQRVLYAGTNPFGEECVVDATLSIPHRLFDELAVAAAPWLDFWRAVYCTIAARATERLRPLVNGPTPLAAFLGKAAANGIALALNGIPLLAAQAFAEVRARFASAFAEQAGERELELSPALLAAVAGGPASFSELTWPSADVQLRASSAEAVKRGDFQWIIAELHPGVAVVQHGLLWGCPDPAAFAADVRCAMDGPVGDFGFAGVDLTTHTTVPFSAFAPSLYCYVGAGAAPSGARSLAPSEVEVVDDGHDLRMRERGTGRDLGSFTRSWALALGFHPFLFRIARRTPRLVVNGVIVQRAMWTISRDDWKPHRWIGVSSDVQLLLECDRLRTHSGIPRHVFIRPTDRAILRVGAGGRDKDAKPIYLDLETMPLVRLLDRWLDKHGEIEITEMLPEPEMMFWRTPEGRHPFELRTLLLPRDLATEP